MLIVCFKKKVINSESFFVLLKTSPYNYKQNQTADDTRIIC